VPSGLSVDVQNEFAGLFEEAGLLARALPSLVAENPAEDIARRWIEIAGVAAAVSDFLSARDAELTG
jgi:hypothetical protein